MPLGTRLAAAVVVALCSVPVRAQTSPGLPAIPSVTNQAQADAVIRERDAFCGPKLDKTPALASYNRPFFCTCMGAQLSAAHTAGTTVTQPILTKMVTDCTGLAHQNTARRLTPSPGGAWVEMSQGEGGRPVLGWGEPDSDAGLSPFWLTCQAGGKTVLTIELGHGRPGQTSAVWLSKGSRNLLVKGSIHNGQNNPVVAASFPTANLLELLGQPDDLMLHDPEHPVRFANFSLAEPMQRFVADCRRH